MSNSLPTTPNLDPFSVVVIFATWSGMTGDFASILAAYSLILLTAFGGAYWSSTGMPQMTWFATLTHILMMMGLALIATVPLAELISRLTGWEIRWLLCPLSLLISARPDWVIRVFRRRLVKLGWIDDADLDAKDGTK